MQRFIWKVKISFLPAEKGFGNATDSGNLIVLVGLTVLFGSIITINQKWTLPLSFFGLSLSMFMLVCSQNLALSSFVVLGNINPTKENTIFFVVEGMITML